MVHVPALGVLPCLSLLGLSQPLVQLGDLVVEAPGLRRRAGQDALHLELGRHLPQLQDARLLLLLFTRHTERGARGGAIAQLISALCMPMFAGGNARSNAQMMLDGSRPGC